jgi:hypothetical protein
MIHVLAAASSSLAARLLPLLKAATLFFYNRFTLKNQSRSLIPMKYLFERCEFLSAG